MSLQFILLPALALFSLAHSLPHPDDVAQFSSRQLPREGKLIVQERQRRGLDARIVAVFQSADGDGIKFKTSQNSLLLTTADEQTTLAKASVIPLTIQSYEESGRATYFQLMDDAFISSNDNVYRVPLGSDVSRAMLASYPLTHRDLVDNLQGELMDNSPAAIQASAERLIGHPAMRLLEPAAQALSKELGITGKEEPASMLFFATAMKLSQLYEDAQRSSSLVHQPTTTPRLNPFISASVQQRLPCLNTCPPCRHLECLGLCGYGCQCWKFLCGDCCAHKGCFLHDKCCRQRGFFTAPCLFPFGFNCNRFTC